MLRKKINYSKNETIKVRIYIDSLENKDPTKIDLMIPKNKKLKKIRKRLPKQYKDENIYWWIDHKFHDQEETIAESVKDIWKDTEFFVFLAVLVTDMKMNGIDYNLELEVSEMFSKCTQLMSPFMCDSKSVKMKETCDKCANSFTKVHIKHFCKHKCCKNCILESVESKSFICPILNCDKNITDHELQEFLSIENYSAVEKNVCESRNTQIKIGWLCSVCEFFNPPLKQSCNMCQRPMQRTYRVPSFYQPTHEDMNQFIKEKENEGKENISNEPILYNEDVVTCQICGEQFQRKKAAILHNCQHSISLNCLKDYLVSCNVAKVKCPMDGCNGIILDPEIRAILTPDEHIAYLDRLPIPKGAYQCRQADCKGLVIPEKKVKKFNCPTCGTKNCIPCKSIHGDMSCAEFQNLLKIAPTQGELTNQIFIKSLTNSSKPMKCPNCKMIISKKIGYDAKKCPNCKLKI